MSILLLGDLVSGEFHSSNINTNSSLVLFNLEAPIIKMGTAGIKKAGPHLFSETITLPVINPNATIVANLANNHIMDFGPDGLKNTITECKKNNVLHIGAGENIDFARSSLIINVESQVIGIIGCCEKQFGAATILNSGVACIGPWVYSAIRNLKAKVDLIIVSVHGASEDSPWPSPDWQELLKSFIDEGANIIHGHHSHVPQGFEEYNNGLIFYGLGNFIVNPKNWRHIDNTLWSLIPEIDISDKKLNYKINISILEENNINFQNIEIKNIDDTIFHQQYLKLCNTPLKDINQLAALWQEVSIRLFYNYYAKYLNLPEGKSKIRKLSSYKFLKSILGAINKNIRHKRISPQEDLLVWYHLLACESHSNAIATALGILGKEINDIRTKESKLLVDKMIPALISKDNSQ